MTSRVRLSLKTPRMRRAVSAWAIQYAASSHERAPGNDPAAGRQRVPAHAQPHGPACRWKHKLPARCARFTPSHLRKSGSNRFVFTHRFLWRAPFAGGLAALRRGWRNTRPQAELRKRETGRMFRAKRAKAWRNGPLFFWTRKPLFSAFSATPREQSLNGLFFISARLALLAQAKSLPAPARRDVCGRACRSPA